MAEECPSLERIRLEGGYYDDEPAGVEYMKVIKERKKAAEKGIKVDGIQMSKIKELTLDFEDYESILQDLRDR